MLLLKVNPFKVRFIFLKKMNLFQRLLPLFKIIKKSNQFKIIRIRKIQSAFLKTKIRIVIALELALEKV